MKRMCATGINYGFTETRGSGNTLFGVNNTSIHSIKQHKFTYKNGKR